MSDFGIDLIRGSSSVIVAQMAAQVTAGTKAGADVNTLSCDIKSRPPSPLRKPLSTDSEMKRVSFASRRTPKMPSKMAHKKMVSGIYFVPCVATMAPSGTTTTAAAPEMTPGRVPSATSDTRP